MILSAVAVTLSLAVSNAAIPTVETPAQPMLVAYTQPVTATADFDHSNPFGITTLRRGGSDDTI